MKAHLFAKKRVATVLATVVIVVTVTLSFFLPEFPETL
jgi:hypothetical protein